MNYESGLPGFWDDQDRAQKTIKERGSLESDLGEYDGGKLLSLKGDLAICHIINDLLTVRMEIDTYILDQYGIKLP